MEVGTIFNYARSNEPEALDGKLIVLKELGISGTLSGQYAFYLCYGSFAKLVVFRSTLPEPEDKEQMVIGDITEILAEDVYIEKYNKHWSGAIEETLQICLELKEDDGVSGIKSANRNIADLLEVIGFKKIASLARKINDIKED